MRNSHLAFIAIALCLFGVCVSATPGAKIAITPTAITDAIRYYLPSVIPKLESMQMPPVSQGDLKITNMVLQNIYLPADDVKVVFTQDHAAFSTDNFGFSLDFHLNDKVLGFIPVSLQLGGQSNNSKLAFDLSFGYTNGFVQLTVNSLSVHIENMSIHYPAGTLSKIIKAITDALGNRVLENLFSSVITNTMKGALQNAINKGLTKIPGVGPVFGPLGVNYQGTKAPVVTPNYLSGHLNGTFYNLEHGFSIPPVVQPENDYPEFNEASDSNIQIFISEYSPNTALNALWESNVLAYNVTNSLIPESAGIKLNIGWLQQFIPNITNFYNDTDIELLTGVQAHSAPVIKITEGDIQINTDLILSFWALKDNEPIKIVSVKSNLEIHANLTVVDWQVKPFIAGGSFGPFTILETNVDQFDPSLFEQGLNFLLMFAFPGFDATNPTFPLPSVPGIDLKAFSVALHNGYVQVEAHPHYALENVEMIAAHINQAFKSQYQSETSAEEQVADFLSF